MCQSMNNESMVHVWLNSISQADLEELEELANCYVKDGYFLSTTYVYRDGGRFRDLFFDHDRNESPTFSYWMDNEYGPIQPDKFDKNFIRELLVQFAKTI